MNAQVASIKGVSATEGNAPNGDAVSDSMEKIVCAMFERHRTRFSGARLNSPLLDAKLRKNHGISIIGESSDELFRLLVIEGKKLPLDPGKVEEEESQEGDLAVPVEASSAKPDHTGDSRIQTAHGSITLQNRLLETNRLAQACIEEFGSNSLYLALGALEWRSKDTPNVTRTAPLYFVPVTLEREGANRRFRLVYSGGDIECNFSLKSRLKAEYGVELLEIDPEVDLEDLVPSKFLASVSDSLDPELGFKVLGDHIQVGLYSSSQIFKARDLDPAIWPEGQKPWDVRVIRSLLNGTFAPAPAPLSLDQLHDPRTYFEVLGLDGSQFRILHRVSAGESLQVQGGPGSGKSHLIAEIIRFFTNQGKKVLFVSEKPSALAAVEKNLRISGQGHNFLTLQHDAVSRSEVIERLRSSLSHKASKTPDREALVTKFEETRATLNAYCEALRTPYRSTGITPYRAMQELLELGFTSSATKSDDRSSPFAFTPMAEWTPAMFTRAVEYVAQFARRIEDDGNPQKHPFFGCKLTQLDVTAESEIKAHLTKVGELGNTLKGAFIELAPNLGISEKTTLGELERFSQALAELAAEPKLHGIDLNDACFKNNSPDSALVTFIAAARTVSERQREHDSANWFAKCFARVSKTGRALGSATKSFEITLTSATKLKEVFGSKWPKDASGVAAFLEVYAAVKKYREAYAGLSCFQEFANLAKGTVNGALARVHTKFSAAYTPFHSAWSNLAAKLELAPESYNSQSLNDLLTKVQSLIPQVPTLRTLVGFNKQAHEARESGFGSIVDGIEQSGDTKGLLSEHLKRSWFQGIYESCFREREALNNFDRLSHEDVIARFRAADGELIAANRLSTRSADLQRRPHLVLGGQFATLSRELKKGRGYKPIRWLFQNAGDAIQATTSAILASTAATAKFIPPGSIQFDVVIFDEAGQVGVEDSFVPLQRLTPDGIVIVSGDEQQMTKTYYFEMLSEGEEVEQDSDAPERGESILSYSARQGMPTDKMDGYYRGLDPSLIRVSNRRFYGNQLRVFPSAQADEKLGLKASFHSDTVYDRGGTRTNVEEAKIVAQAVMDHARNDPDKSLLVIAFSEAQMKAINREVERLRRERPELEPFFSAHPHEPFMVINLEEVQGLERDVVFISLGYGFDKDGKLPMTFGPVNQERGPQRLNVGFTRPKRLEHLFCNFKSTDLRVDDTGEGVAALQEYMQEAEEGCERSLPKESIITSKDPFIREIGAALTKRGLVTDDSFGSTCPVRLGVVDTVGNTGYALGIIVDDERYQNQELARERDAIEEQMLSLRGWNIVRVWSPDWIRDPVREVARIEAILDKTRQNRYPGIPQRSVPNVDETSAVNEFDISQFGTSSPEPYTLTNLKGHLPDNGARKFSQYTEHDFAELITRVVNVEGPVQNEVVFDRIRAASGSRSDSNETSKRFAAGRLLAQQGGRIRCGPQFMLYPIAPGELSVRNRDELPRKFQKFEYIPPEELDLAILTTVKESCGISREELPGGVCKLFGFSKEIDDAAKYIAPRLDELLRSGHLFEQRGFLQVSFHH